MTIQPASHARFSAIQMYAGQWNVMDLLTGGIVATCELQWESGAEESEMEIDARFRADAIARYFNSSGRQWLAPRTDD